MGDERITTEERQARTASELALLAERNRTAPAQPEGEQVIRKKRARRIIDVVIGSPCIVETRFFSQPEEQEKLENQVAALLGQLEREQLENEIFQDATDPAWTPSDTPVVARELYSELINIAAGLARGEGFISPCFEDHSGRTPKGIVIAAQHQEDVMKDWANRIRRVADKLRATTTAPDETAVGGEAEKCLKCHHAGFLADLQCFVRMPDGSRCNCKCEFAAVGGDEGEEPHPGYDCGGTCVIHAAALRSGEGK